MPNYLVPVYNKGGVQGFPPTKRGDHPARERLQPTSTANYIIFVFTLAKTPVPTCGPPPPHKILWGRWKGCWLSLKSIEWLYTVWGILIVLYVAMYKITSLFSMVSEAKVIVFYRNRPRLIPHGP